MEFRLEIFKSFKVDAAHSLPNVPCGHKCGKMHGHTFKITVHVGGKVDQRAGWIVDFGDISQAFAPIAELLDHSCLNDIEGLANPTSENMAIWLWRQLKPSLPGLVKLVVQESPDSGCIYCGEDE